MPKESSAKTRPNQQTTRSDEISLDSLNALGAGGQGCRGCREKQGCNCTQLEYLKNLAHKNVD